MSRKTSIEDLTAEERLELIGELSESLDAEIAAPLTPSLAAELDRREAEADADPDSGDSWPEIRAELERALR